jgi:hypothetical protein
MFRDNLSDPSSRAGETTIHCVISQQSADLIYFTAEAWNHEQGARWKYFTVRRFQNINFNELGGGKLQPFCVQYLGVQPFSDLGKSCIPRYFTQVKFYVSQNFPKLNYIKSFRLMHRKNYRSALQNVQQKDQDKCQYKRKYIIIYIFPMGCKTHFHDFLKFAPASKNLCKSSII